MKCIEYLLDAVRSWFGQAAVGSEKSEAIISVLSAGKERVKFKSVDFMSQMESFLADRFEFRFNELTEETEYRKREVENSPFHPVGQRELNSFCIAARKKGIDCWDRDVSRFVYSENTTGYHPFHLYMEELPAWDGVDRVGPLARRISDTALWISGFHRWMLAMTAQWMELDQLHANSVSPVLISRKQGKQKSTFCKMLLPSELQRYYTDSFDLNVQATAERKLCEFGLIN